MQCWLCGLPGSKFETDALPGLTAQPQGRWRHGPDSVEWLSRQADGEQQQAGIRYTRFHQGISTCFTLIFCSNQQESGLNIRVEQHYGGSTIQLAPFRHALLMRGLLGTSLGGAQDGALKVQNTPHVLTHSDVDLAAQLIRQEASCRLPVVYVSAGFGGEGWRVDTEQLADRLAGMAHVVVEPNRHFSVRLKLATQGKNVYGGSVGIHWPDGRPRRAFFLGPLFPDGHALADAVFEDIRHNLLARPPRHQYTWASLQEASQRQTVQMLKDAGSDDLAAYIETFDQEIADYQHRLNEAEEEIRRLRLQLSLQASQLQSMNGSLLKMGHEQPLYSNEFQLILLEAIEDTLNRVPPDSRRQHVLQSIADANALPQDAMPAYREQLKNLLRGMKGMTPNIRRGLEHMGFAITEGSKHTKLVFQGDDRYTHTLPASGSDWRGGLNAAADMARLLF